mgnify:CR=1 FL=1
MRVTQCNRLVQVACRVAVVLELIIHVTEKILDIRPFLFLGFVQSLQRNERFLESLFRDERLCL